MTVAFSVLDDSTHRLLHVEVGPSTPDDHTEFEALVYDLEDQPPQVYRCVFSARALKAPIEEEGGSCDDVLSAMHAAALSPATDTQEGGPLAARGFQTPFPAAAVLQLRSPSLPGHILSIPPPRGATFSVHLTGLTALLATSQFLQRTHAALHAAQRSESRGESGAAHPGGANTPAGTASAMDSGPPAVCAAKTVPSHGATSLRAPFRAKRSRGGGLKVKR